MSQLLFLAPPTGLITTLYSSDVWNQLWFLSFLHMIFTYPFKYLIQCCALVYISVLKSSFDSEHQNHNLLCKLHYTWWLPLHFLLITTGCSLTVSKTQLVTCSRKTHFTRPNQSESLLGVHSAGRLPHRLL